MRFHEILFQTAFYLEKQKSFIHKKENFLSRCQNKKTLFTDSILREGFVQPYSQEHLLGNLSSEKVEIVRDSTKSTLKSTFLSFKFLPHFGECLSEILKVVCLFKCWFPNIKMLIQKGFYPFST